MVNGKGNYASLYHFKKNFFAIFIGLVVKYSIAKLKIESCSFTQMHLSYFNVEKCSRFAHIHSDISVADLV